ncbi:sec-independent protein translocase protein TatA [Actinomycetospora succinea]|uniref:Sec-independent protein translocase protein TatA n=1 Tax=Actinomycetospora succinea TaxID=663603 RepID=A0A4R6V164_9PSEU|nr:Sec-independent protein translocase subunit TatA [Actinomycetospora succinea]TDQ51715.1 sec-independent protein translocase protein TatA [Actinomycetospora succinea]
MSEWVIVAIVGVVLLFSAKKLPDMARGLGQSMRIFKAETRGLREDEKAEKGTAEPQAPGRALDEAPTSTNGTTPASQDSPATRPGSTSS